MKIAAVFRREGKMFCPQCGKEYTQRVNFCCHCGAALSVPPARPRKKLARSRTDRKIAGVCGGFADYLELDVIGETATNARDLAVGPRARKLLAWSGWRH